MNLLHSLPTIKKPDYALLSNSFDISTPHIVNVFCGNDGSPYCLEIHPVHFGPLHPSQNQTDGQHHQILLINIGQIFLFNNSQIEEPSAKDLWWRIF